VRKGAGDTVGRKTLSEGPDSREIEEKIKYQNEKSTQKKKTGKKKKKKKEKEKKEVK